jgi:CRISPR-associated endonuclease/helicase Cas3
VPAPTKTAKTAAGEHHLVRFEQCWAKTTDHDEPGISVRDHCLNVGCVAEALLQLIPPHIRNLIPEGAATLAALHDIGKVSPGFQAKCPAWLLKYSLHDNALAGAWGARESDHAKISQFTAQQLLRSSAVGLWAVAVGAHHGKIKGEHVHVGEPWEEERRRLAGELIAEFGSLPDRAAGEAPLWFLAGLITVADWIGSDEGHFPQDAEWDSAERRGHATRALAAIGWNALEAKRALDFTACFPELAGPNALQRATVDLVQGRGVYVIEAPMGSGKTEAALAAAYQLFASGQASGLYFALPTRISSNRIHLRVQSFLDQIAIHPVSARLAHSSSWLTEAKPPAQLSPAISSDQEARDHVRAGRSWFASVKRALLAPFGVGTVDQALLGIVAAKHFFIRQFGLAGKVVVLDEVHSYDLYTGTLIERLIERLRELRCTVVILSATLTEERRCALLGLNCSQSSAAAYPRLTAVTASVTERACDPPPSKTVYITHLPGHPPVEEAMDCACRGECVLWIRNTVEDAQQTYRALQSARVEGGPEVALLHSRFPFFRREQLEDEWMERLGKDPAPRPPGCVLVSTQVAEQSVDIDADLLITDLAPTDMLLQRLGRLWRHDRKSRPCHRPEIWIQVPALDRSALRKASAKELRQSLGRSAHVYAPYILLRSLSQWSDIQSVTLPEDIRAILEATYADAAADEPSAWGELRRELQRRREELSRLALTATNIWSIPALEDEEGVQTRYSSYPWVQLLLAREVTPLGGYSARLRLLDGQVVTAQARGWSFEAAKAIHRNLAPVPRWAAAGAPSPPAWLVNHVAGPAVAGVVGPGGEVSWYNGDQHTALSYSTEQGVLIGHDSAPLPSDEDFDEPCD